jgi:hypothetical protein
MKPRISIHVDRDEWFDITEDVISPIKFKYGIFGIGPTDRVADVGTIKFTLKNLDRKYYGDSTQIPGFGRGMPVFLHIGFSDVDKCFWTGTIDTLTFKDPIGGIPTVDVVGTDRMDYLVNYSVPFIPIAYNQTIHDAKELILALIPQCADWIGYEWDGTKVFPTVFDSDERTSAYAEFNKLALSELSYIYMRRGYALQPEFRVEDAAARTNLDYLNWAVFECYSGSLDAETSDDLLQETGDHILLNERLTVAINDDVIDSKVTYGDNLITQFNLKAYPRSIDSASSVLFSMDEPIYMEASSAKYFKVTYLDPSGGEDRIAGKDMITPTPYLDYTLNQYESGSGTDYTDFCNVNPVNEQHEYADYGAFSTILKVRNQWAAPLYVTKLQCRGTATYFKNPIELLVSASSSVIETYGTIQEKLDQKYVTDITSGEGFANQLLGREQTPRTVLKSIKMIANSSPELMTYFLWADLGDKIHITLSEYGISTSYFIQGEEVTIGLDGIITFEWTVIENILYTDSIFTLDNATYDKLDSQNVLGY